MPVLNNLPNIQAAAGCVAAPSLVDIAVELQRGFASVRADIAVMSTGSIPSFSAESQSFSAARPSPIEISPGPAKPAATRAGAPPSLTQLPVSTLARGCCVDGRAQKSVKRRGLPLSQAVTAATLEGAVSIGQQSGLGRLIGSTKKGCAGWIILPKLPPAEPFAAIQSTAATLITRDKLFLSEPPEYQPVMQQTRIATGAGAYVTQSQLRNNRVVWENENQTALASDCPATVPAAGGASCATIADPAAPSSVSPPSTPHREILLQEGNGLRRNNGQSCGAGVGYGGGGVGKRVLASALKSPAAAAAAGPVGIRASQSGTPVTSNNMPAWMNANGGAMGFSTAPVQQQPAAYGYSQSALRAPPGIVGSDSAPPGIVGSDSSASFPFFRSSNAPENTASLTAAPQPPPPPPGISVTTDRLMPSHECAVS